VVVCWWLPVALALEERFLRLERPLCAVTALQVAAFFFFFLVFPPHVERLLRTDSACWLVLWTDGGDV
jgi:hypothetical protein